MTNRTQRTLAVVSIGLAASVAMLADLTGTVSLASGGYFSLDTAKTTNEQPSGGDTYDLLWTATGLAPQGKAKAFNVGNLRSLNGFTKSYFDNLKIVASASAIANRLLVAGDVFAIFTNSGQTAAALVTANNGTTLTLQYVTFTGTAAGGGGPAITAIENNSSRVPQGYTNYGIAPSSLFIVVGTGLADAGKPVLQSSESPGLPTELNGASITVVVNGVTVHPALYYTSPTQLAAVMPAATPIGSGTLTVAYRGATSAPATIQVVPVALGFNTYNTSTGVATDATTGALLSYNNAGSPGETIVLWATGLGADSADSDTTYTLTPHRVETPLQIYIGGVQANILYQGASVYPGVNQINLTIPDSVSTGCWVPLIAGSGTFISKAVTLPIHRGGGACVDAISGLNGDQISPGGGRTLRTGFVGLLQVDAPNRDGTRTKTNSTDGAFVKYTGLYEPANSVSPGGCIVGPVVASPVPGLSTMDPGNISLTSSTGVNTTLAPVLGIKGTFYSPLSADAIPSSGGTFTYKGSGGADVGPFTSTVTLSNPVMTWTNPQAAATVIKLRGLDITWTGGNPDTYVLITGVSLPGSRPAGALGASAYHCLAPAADGHFTVPAYILQALPDGTGSTQVQNNIQVPLTADGLDIGVALASVSYSANSTYGSGATR